MLTLASERLLVAIEGGEPEASPRNFPTSMGPTVVKISDPVDDVEKLLEIFDDGAPAAPPPNRWMQAQRGRLPKLQMRRCCLARLQAVDSVLQQLPPTSRHECPACGTVWEVSYQVREER